MSTDKPIIPSLEVNFFLTQEVYNRYSANYMENHWDELPKVAAVKITLNSSEQIIISEVKHPSRTAFIRAVQEEFAKYTGFTAINEHRLPTFFQSYGITAPRIFSKAEKEAYLKEYWDKKEKEGKAIRFRPIPTYSMNQDFFRYFNQDEVFKLLEQNYPATDYHYGYIELIPSGEYAVRLLNQKTGKVVHGTLRELQKQCSDKTDSYGRPLIDIAHLYDETGAFKFSDAYLDAHPTKNRSTDDDF